MFDAAGAPINLKTEAWQRYTGKYDDRGNLVEEAVWMADGSPGKRLGCHRLRSSYDERGNLVRVACLDQQGQAAIADDGDYAAWEIHYDDKGRVAEYTYYDKDRQPATGPEGAFRVAYGYDTDDNMTSIAYFSAKGQQTVGGSGYHKQISTFKDGREVRTEYVGVDSKPVVLGGGYATIERKFDARGNEEQTAYLDAKKHSVRNQYEGYAVKRASFDACGRETESRYLDEHEKPIRLDMGYPSSRKFTMRAITWWRRPIWTRENSIHAPQMATLA
jgi:YD repeat-containing protein